MIPILLLLCSSLLQALPQSEEQIEIQRKRLHFCGCDVATSKESCLIYEKCYWIEEKCVPEGSEQALYVEEAEEEEEELGPLFPEVPLVPKIEYIVHILNEEEVEYEYFEESAEESVVALVGEESAETTGGGEESETTLELVEEQEEKQEVEFAYPFEVASVQCDEFKEQEQCEVWRWPYKFFCVWQDDKCQEGSCEDLTALQCEKTFFCAEYGRCESCLPAMLSASRVLLSLLTVLALLH